MSRYVAPSYEILECRVCRAPRGAMVRRRRDNGLVWAEDASLALSADEYESPKKVCIMQDGRCRRCAHRKPQA